MRKRNKYYIRTFQCPDCGGKMYAPKVRRQTFSGHIKTMYCPWCQAKRDMVQVEADKV